MPGMDSVEFVSKIRRHPLPSRRTVPVIALTGFEERYLPVDLDRLCGTIQSVIAQRRKLTQITAANDKLRHGGATYPRLSTG